MKTYQKTIRVTVFIILLFSVTTTLFAFGNSDKYFTISGVVKDKSKNKKLDYVHISVSGSNLSSCTNEEGFFSLKIKDSIDAKEIVLSRLGYHNTRIPFERKDKLNETFFLTSNTGQLAEKIDDYWDFPVDVIKEAFKKVSDNYSIKPHLLTGFYRETILKGRKYIGMTEAVLFLYKHPYFGPYFHNDRVQIHQGHNLISAKASDTLAVKLMGGPNLANEADFVKNREFLFDEQFVDNYHFKMEKSEFLDNRQQMVIRFTPAVVLPYPLFYGTLYIDMENLSFTRAEFFLDLKDKNKAISAILRNKPAGLRFKPELIYFVVSYTQRDGISYLNYVRNEIKFKCDWKRKLFSTGYTVQSEMVVTDRKEEEVSSISRKDSFNERESLTDKVKHLYDTHCWDEYNIIEPTESQKSAVKKLIVDNQ